MKSRFLVVDKKILPSYFEKVVEARSLLNDGEAKDVSEAVRRVGISRSTYYKYKDYVMELSSDAAYKKAIVSMVLINEPGILSSIISLLKSYSVSIWTINQNPPINTQANVVITMDISNAVGSVDDLLDKIKEEKGVVKASLIGIE